VCFPSKIPLAGLNSFTAPKKFLLKPYKVSNMKYSHPVTPVETKTAYIKVIIEHLSTVHDPVYVDVVLDESAQVDNCFENVENYAKEHGGERVLGWTIWELPSLYVEAEFHAVWKNDAGQLIDITPKRQQTRRILFLRDDATPYVGNQVNNLRVPISREPAIMRLFEACEREFELINKGDRKSENGVIALTGRDALEHSLIMQEKMAAVLEIRSKTPMISAYSPCACGSGSKTKWCCGVPK
jgi:hypothetical protein